MKCPMFHDRRYNQVNDIVWLLQLTIEREYSIDSLDLELTWSITESVFHSHDPEFGSRKSRFRW